MSPFITGSHAYGTPTLDSDVDLVIPPTSHEDFEVLETKSDYGIAPLHFGKLNLIVAKCPASFQAWKDGTEQLKAMKPVTREFAIQFLDNLFESRGLQKSLADSGEPDE